MKYSQFLRLAGGAAAAVSVALLASDEQQRVPPGAALELLMAGNSHYVSGRPIHPDQGVNRRTKLAMGQQPFAIVLTCADSRVAPELYFDQGLGNIFVLRNAGNVLDDHVIGSIEYAVEHLGAGLIIVVGHSQCGAVAATVAGGRAPGHISSIVESIQPAVDSVAGQSGDKVDHAVRAHARMVAAALRRSKPILSEAVNQGHLRVVAARYDLASGKVELLDSLAGSGPEQPEQAAASHHHEPQKAN